MGGYGRFTYLDVILGIQKKWGEGFDMKSEEKMYVIYYFLGFQHTLIHFQYKEQIYFYIHDHRFRT